MLMLSISDENACNFTIYIMLLAEYLTCMSNSLFPEAQYPDTSMSTTSIEFMHQMQACDDEDSRRKVREQVMSQSRSLIQNIGHYPVAGQLEASPFTSQPQ